MRNKKIQQAYKKGMVDGAAPFAQKEAEVALQLKKQNRKLDDISDTQRSSRRTLKIALDAMEETDTRSNQSHIMATKANKQAAINATRLNRLERMAPAATKLCEHCGAPMSLYQMVCSACGTVSKQIPYEVSEFNIANQCIAGMQPLSSLVQEANKGVDYGLYPELEPYFTKMRKIQLISAQYMKEKGSENARIYSKINRIATKFFSDCEKKHIEISVVGTVKAGKSTLINALLGAQLASVDPTPETSILVKYHTTSAGNYLKIRFYKDSEWNRLWNDAQKATVFRSEFNRLNAAGLKDEYLNHPDELIKCSNEDLPKLMMEWSKSDSPKHFYVKEIEVGYESEDLPHDVYLVDTPGLSDPVKYRSDITRSYIKHSDWVLACIVAENLSQQPEFKFLSQVITNKGGDVSKVFVVATKRDMLTHTECEKKAAEFLARLSELYNNQAVAQNRFTLVSAELHTLTNKVLHDEEPTDEEFGKICISLLRVNMRYNYTSISEHRQEILDYAGINRLYDLINTNVLRKRRQYLIKEIKEDYIHSMDLINSNANLYINEGQGFLQAIVAGHEQNQESINEIQQTNQAIRDLQEKVKALRIKLDRELKKDGLEPYGEKEV